MILEVFSPGKPIPKQSFRIGGKGRPGWQPKRITQYQKRTAWAVKAAAREQGWKMAEENVAVAVSIRFIFPRPIAAKKADRDRWGYRTARPDIDNLTKSVLDSLSQAKVWADDQQVARIEAEKVLAPRGREGVWIRVEVLDNAGFHEGV